MITVRDKAKQAVKPNARIFHRGVFSQQRSSHKCYSSAFRNRRRVTASRGVEPAAAATLLLLLLVLLLLLTRLLLLLLRIREIDIRGIPSAADV